MVLSFDQDVHGFNLRMLHSMQKEDGQGYRKWLKEKVDDLIGCDTMTLFLRVLWSTSTCKKCEVGLVAA